MHDFFNGLFLILISGMVSESACKMEEAQEDNQRFPVAGHFATNTRFASVSVWDGRQSLLFSCQRHSLGRGWDAWSLTAADSAFAGPTAGDGTVPVPVQSRSWPPTKLHGPFQQLIVKRFRSSITSVSTHISWDGARVPLGSNECDRLTSAV